MIIGNRSNQAVVVGWTGVYSFLASVAPSGLGLLPPRPPLPPAGLSALSPVGAFSRSRLTLLTLPLSSKNSYCLFSSFLKIN